MHCEIAGVALTTAQCVCAQCERDRERGTGTGTGRWHAVWGQAEAACPLSGHVTAAAGSDLPLLLTVCTRSEVSLPQIGFYSEWRRNTYAHAHTHIYRICNLCASAEKTNEWFVLLLTFLLIYPEGGSPRDVDVVNPLSISFPSTAAVRFIDWKTAPEMLVKLHKNYIYIKRLRPHQTTKRNDEEKAKKLTGQVAKGLQQQQPEGRSCPQ